MGKTFRNQKTFKARPTKLHTHRDLPDIQDDFEDDYDLDDEDNNYAIKLRTKKQDVVRPEGEPHNKEDNR